MPIKPAALLSPKVAPKADKGKLDQTNTIEIGETEINKRQLLLKIPNKLAVNRLTVGSYRYRRQVQSWSLIPHQKLAHQRPRFQTHPRIKNVRTASQNRRSARPATRKGSPSYLCSTPTCSCTTQIHCFALKSTMFISL